MAEDRAKAEENVEELEKWARVRERAALRTRTGTPSSRFLSVLCVK